MSELLMFISGMCLGAAIVMRRDAGKPLPQVAAVGSLPPGSVVLLQTERLLSRDQHAALRAHLDKLEAHSGSKFVVIDGGLKPVTVKCSE